MLSFLEFIFRQHTLNIFAYTATESLCYKVICNNKNIFLVATDVNDLNHTLYRATSDTGQMDSE